MFTNGENDIIIFMPNQLFNARGIIFRRDTVPFSQLQFEFDKNANSDSVVVKIILFRRVGLATIGVCFFCAVTSVDALFILSTESGDERQITNFEQNAHSKYRGGYLSQNYPWLYCN